MSNSTYIALLRGINVSGQKKIKMADLRVLMDKLGFFEVQTYIQSGNIVFQAKPEKPELLAERIKDGILAEYGWEVPVLVMQATDIKSAISGYPWAEKPDRTPEQIYLTFLETTPDPDRVAALDQSAYAPEEFVLSNKVIYFFSPNGYGRAKMNNNFFEKKLKVKATTRNWRSTNKLLEMAKS